MAICMGMECAHMDECSGKCTFSGMCIVRRYNLDNMASLKAALGTSPVESETDLKSEMGQDVAFNPFQRGNGCMLAGYTHDEIWAHTR